MANLELITGLTARSSEDATGRQFVLRQTLYRRFIDEYREFGKRGEVIDEDCRNRLHLLYRNKRLHFGDEEKTSVNLVASAKELYREI